MPPAAPSLAAAKDLKRRNIHPNCRGEPAPLDPIQANMRIDKLTTKFQQALADAQSQALAHDNGFIEPQHLLLALLNQEDGGTTSLLQRAGVNVGALRKGLEDAIGRLPKVEGQGGEIGI